MFRSRFAFCLALAAAALALAAVTCSAAAPGARFVFEQCDSALPGGAVPATSPSYNIAVFSPTQNCASPNGWVGLAETGPANATFAALGIAVPETPGGFVESVTVNAVGYLPGATHLSHVEADDFPGPLAESVRIFHQHSEREWFSNAGSLEVAMSCDANVGPCPGAGPYVGARYIAATEVDPNPPVVGAITGTILSGATLRGHQTLAAEASDLGGGLSALAPLVNGLAIAPMATSCGVVAVANQSVYGAVVPSPTPCPPALRNVWALDTGAYPFHDGANTVAICASDFATIGNPNTSCSPPHSVSVDNSCTESPVPGGEAISAQFAGSNAEQITVGYGTEAEVSGELRDNAGDAISGATICVKSQTLGIDPAAQPVGAVKTDAAGRFAYRVPAGPNRELLLGYRHDAAQVARSVRYYAHAAPSLAVDPPKLRNGHGIHLWGALPEPGAAKRVVVLQANVVGSKRWITFRRATTDAHGDFKTGYQFHSTTRRTRYRFRAIVPVQDHYPYVEGHSKPVSVLVRPKRHSHRP